MEVRACGSTKPVWSSKERKEESADWVDSAATPGSQNTNVERRGAIEEASEDIVDAQLGGRCLKMVC